MSIVNLITLRVGVLVQKYGYIDISENALVFNKKISTPWHRSDKLNSNNQHRDYQTCKLHDCKTLFFRWHCSQSGVCRGGGGGGVKFFFWKI